MQTVVLNVKKNRMTVTYDKYYQTENLFGEPYPELIEFFTECPKKGKVLDLGCGQGRDAIALARLGYSVTGIDNSKVGIDQMNQIGQNENLDLVGQVGDIYAFDQFSEFDIVLMDSMFHFAKKDMEKEIGLIKKTISEIRVGSLVVVCIQDTGEKVLTLNKAIDFERKQKRLADKKLKYIFEDSESGHKSETDYRMIVIEK
jgi:2-polyprenyl-3-methyl-5-hydroxy-6-metoxy-1,4-benzoquinol methylase